MHNGAMFIYVHIPFCVSRCIYCDFYVTLEKYGGQGAFVDALCREIEARLSRAALPDNTVIETIYFGGGTPSLLPASDYMRILRTFRQFVPIARNAEITFEANPGGRREAMKSPPETYLEAGLNRISVGVQSLDDAELLKLSRVHTAAEAEGFIAELKQAGWQNISMDLMYAIPGQTPASWAQALERTLALGVQHVSMYGLKVEENTPLERLQARGSYGLPTEDDAVAMYFHALDILESRGFHRYEFSNLSLPGFASRHNLNYWSNGEYWAFGPSAHGYVNGNRYENVRDLARYLENPLAGESAPCPADEQLENAIIFGLRKAEGIDVPALEREYRFDFRQRYGHVLKKYADSEGPAGNCLVWQGQRLVLAKTAIPLSNGILAEFLN